MTKTQLRFVTICTISVFLFGLTEPITSFWRQATPLTFMLTIVMIILNLPEKIQVIIRNSRP
jgi:hypothetical protein